MKLQLPLSQIFSTLLIWKSFSFFSFIFFATKQNWSKKRKSEKQMLPEKKWKRQWRWRRGRGHERRAKGLGFWCRRLGGRARRRLFRAPELGGACRSCRRWCWTRRRRWLRRPPPARTEGTPSPLLAAFALCVYGGFGFSAFEAARFCFKGLTVLTVLSLKEKVNLGQVQLQVTTRPFVYGSS